MDEEVYTTEEIFERDTPLTENLFDNSDGFTLSPITMLRRYMAKKELQKQNEEMEDEMEMDSEPMSYMNGGGIGSMMQPRQNYAIGGDIEQSDFGLQNIINSNLQNNTNMQTAGFLPQFMGGTSDEEDAAQNSLQQIQDLRKNQMKGIPRGTTEAETQSIINDLQYTNPTKLEQYQNIEKQIQDIKNQNKDSQQFKDIGGQTASLINVNDITNRNNGNFLISAANALPNQTGTINSATNIMSPGVRTMEGSLIDGDDPSSRYAVQKDFPTNGIAAALGSSRSNQLEGYQDMIMNPEGFPNALQNLERFQDNRFSDLDFQPGYDFIDAPNKTNTLSDLYQNRGYNNNPYTGLFDKNIMSTGNPDQSLVNKTKRGIGAGANIALGTLGKMANLPAGLASILGNMITRNPNAPSYQGEDFYDSNKDSDTFGTTRFDRAKPGSFASFRTLSDYFNRNKKKAETIGQDKVKADKMAASIAAEKASAASLMSKNPNYGNNYNPNRGGGYTGAKDSYGNKSGTRQSNARSSDLGFSDIRLKDNIELVGKSPSDINIYNFTYLNDPTVYQGVMAQEVPWASVKHDNGYLMVDYNKVDVDFKRQ